ncbi:hypothetical protein Ancab_009077 [Ancistrocladus abbreviatus]
MSHFSHYERCQVTNEVCTVHCVASILTHFRRSISPFLSLYPLDPHLSSVFSPLFPTGIEDGRIMAGNAAKTVAKAVGEYQYPWREKLMKYKDELAKGVWGYWELGARKPLGLGISACQRARLQKDVLLAGEDWPYDPERKVMRTKRKGHKCDRIAAEKKTNTTELMKKMPQLLLDYKKRKWEKKMKEEDSKK